MNLIDAIKSGKPFRRPSWPSVLYNQNHWVTTVCRLWDKDTDANIREDILADDWQIQEPTVTITRAQFWEAYSNAMKDWQANHAYPVAAHAPVEVIVPALASKLGLEGE